jgi:DNA-binding transcriptional regulator YhcF (GntR family)
MQIHLSRNSDVPLQEQIAEQVVFLISTGKIRAGQQLPSVRAMAVRLKIHHNTVSKAYQELVRRGWLVRRRGSRLFVEAAGESVEQSSKGDLDGLINETIQRAWKMGYSLQVLQERVMERVYSAPPDCVVVVEAEPGLREIIRTELMSRVSRRVKAYSPEELPKSPELAARAQVAAPDYAVRLVKSIVPRDRPCVPLTSSGADEHVTVIQQLTQPSTIAVASISKTLLKAARGLLASAIGERHTLKEVLISPTGTIDLRGTDLVFCDSVAMAKVRCKKKIHYRLVALESMEALAATLSAQTDYGGGKRVKVTRATRG